MVKQETTTLMSYGNAVTGNLKQTLQPMEQGTAGFKESKPAEKNSTVE